MFEHVWKSYVRNIIERNPHADFEVHLHMYHDLLKIFTPRSFEEHVHVENVTTIKTILESVDVPINIVTSNQTEFDHTLFDWFGKGRNATLHDYDRYTTRNIFRQANSMKEAFDSALGEEELSLATNLKRNQCGNNTIYVFIRSDTLLLTPIDIPQTGIQSNDIYMPNWAVWKCCAYNDRFALTGPIAAERYVEAKSLGFKQIILDKMSKGESLGTVESSPERMLRTWLNQKGDLNIYTNDDWAKLLRIRADGKINFMDRGLFKMSGPQYVQNLSYAWTPLVFSNYTSN
jgi:hypothetical protein